MSVGLIKKYFFNMQKLRISKEKLLFLLSLLLIVLSFAYLIKGFYHLTLDDNNPIDLAYRWKEQQYIYRGIYPYHAGPGSPKIEPTIGAVKSGGYPPWAFFTGFIFIPGISLVATRFYFAILNLISLVILAIFAYQIGIPYGKTQALFSISASLALGSHATTLLNGQYGIIINAFLIGMFWSIEKYKNIWAGLLLGIATIKPNISALYFFILLIRWRIKAILSFFIYLIGGSIVIWIVTKVDPISMTSYIIYQSKYFADQGFSSINFLTIAGIDLKLATILMALVGTIVITAIFYIWRNSSLLTLFAIASVIGRVWTYHRFYDNVMLIFLLLALLDLTFRNPQQINILILTLLGISLWLPGRIVTISYLATLTQFIQFFIWIGALIYLLIQEKLKLKKLGDW
jgi:Glycosyltransferase family 87